jgi:HEAT repeat protein
MYSLSLCLLFGGMIGAQNTDTPVVETLIDALKDPDVEIRLYAGTALAQLGPTSVDPLRKALDTGDKNSRSGACYALGQMGAAALPAKQQLLKALKDSERDVRRQAAYALSRLLSAETETPLSPPPPPVFPEYPAK